MKVLVAEDDPTSRLAITALLTGWGYEVTSVGDGAAAWQVLRQEDAPPLAVLDWLMPGMDGLEVCRHVRGSAPARPTYVILLTALAGHEDVVAGLEGGADDYVAKPADPDELRARVRAGQRVVELQAALAARVAQLEAALAQLPQFERFCD
jgi:DNA-binding response OmpR family regulator